MENTGNNEQTEKYTSNHTSLQLEATRESNPSQPTLLPKLNVLNQIIIDIRKIAVNND